MDRHRPGLDWCRFNQIRAGPVPGSAGVGVGWSKSGPVGALAAERSQETLYIENCDALHSSRKELIHIY